MKTEFTDSSVTSCSLFIKKSPSLRRLGSFRICQPENKEVFHQMHSLTFISLCVDNWDSVEQRTHFTLNKRYLCRRADLMANMRERECLPSQTECHRYDRGKRRFSSTLNPTVSRCAGFFLCLQHNVSFWQTIPQLAGLKSVWPSSAWSTSWWSVETEEQAELSKLNYVQTCN